MNGYPTFRCSDCSLMRCFEPGARCEECWYHFVNRKTDKTPPAPPRSVTAEDVKAFCRQYDPVFAQRPNNPLPPGGVTVYPTQAPDPVTAPTPIDWTSWEV